MLDNTVSEKFARSMFGVGILIGAVIVAIGQMVGFHPLSIFIIIAIVSGGQFLLAFRVS